MNARAGWCTPFYIRSFFLLIMRCLLSRTMMLLPLSSLVYFELMLFRLRAVAPPLLVYVTTYESCWPGRALWMPVLQLGYAFEIEFSGCLVPFMSFSPCMSGRNLVIFCHHDRSSHRASIRFVFRGRRPDMSPRIGWFCHF